jgi:hypothetical protein
LLRFLGLFGKIEHWVRKGGARSSGPQARATNPAERKTAASPPAVAAAAAPAYSCCCCRSWTTANSICKYVHHHLCLPRKKGV